MKTIRTHIFTFSLLLFFPSVKAQWIQQNVSMVANFTSIEAISADTAVAAIASGGYGGNANLDGGNTWDVTLQTFTPLFQLSVSPSGYGWMAGGSNMGLQTTDFGQTWAPIFTAVSEDPIDVLVLDSNNIFVLEKSFAFRKSTNAGISWSTDTISIWNGALAHPSGTNLFLACNQGPFQNLISIFKSTDLGDTWAPAFVDSSNLTANLTAMHFPDATTGYAVGYGAILKTTDGGNTWDLTQSAMNMTGVFFETASTGYVCTMNGEIFKTTNGGGSWALQLDILQPLWDIKCASPDNCFCGGDSSYVFKTSNGGTNGISSPESDLFSEVNIFPNPSVGELNISGSLKNAHPGEIEIRISDISGREISVFSETMMGNEFHVQKSFPALDNGVYLVKIIAGESSFSGKWMKAN